MHVLIKILMKVIFQLGQIALSLAGINSAKEKILNVINDGSAYEVFDKMVYEHGGNINNISCDYNNNIEIKAKKSGIFQFINTKKVGQAINFINILNGKKDNQSGAEFFKKNNDKINRGDLIMRLFANNMSNLIIAKKLVNESYIIK